MRVAAAFLAQPTALRRTSAIAVLIAAVLAAWVCIARPLASLALSQREWRTQTRAALAHARGEAALEPRLREELRTLPSASVWERFYEDRSPSSAESELRQDLTALVRASGGTLDSVEMLAASTSGALRSHGVQVSASMSIEQLRSFLAGVRSHRRYLRIEHLSVKSPLFQLADTNPVLTVKVDVFGFSAVRAGEHP